MCVKLTVVDLLEPVDEVSRHQTTNSHSRTSHKPLSIRYQGGDSYNHRKVVPALDICSAYTENP